MPVPTNPVQMSVGLSHVGEGIHVFIEIFSELGGSVH